MADISQEELKEEITAILKDADLSALSGKKVRQQIEEKLDIDLSSRRKEVDELVMACLQKSKKKNGSANNKSDDDEDEEDEDEEDEEEEEEKPKRAPKKPAPKRKQASSDESDDASDEDKDDDYSPKKKTKPAKKPAKKGRKKGSESEGSDEDWGKKKKTPKKAGGGKGGGGGYTKAIKLSPELSELMGEEAMPRHEVVKRIWALIKEKNLYDPKNKQFAICNDELFKVFGVKRFRTFGMMKLLKDHFIAS